MNWGGEESNSNTNSFAERFHEEFKEDFLKNIAAFFLRKIKMGEDMKKYSGKMKSYIKEIYADTEYSDLFTSIDEKHYVKLGVDYSERALNKYLRKQEKLANLPAKQSKLKRTFASRSFVGNVILGKTKKKHSPHRKTRRHNDNKNVVMNGTAKEMTVSLRKKGFDLGDLSDALNEIK